MSTSTVPVPAADAANRDDPPAWASSLARHRAGLRKLIRSLLEEEAGTPMWALDALLAAIPADERARLLADLRWADGEGRLCPVDSAIDALVYAYETHVAAAYQHGPHLGRWQDATLIAAAAVDVHADEILGALADMPVTVIEVTHPTEVAHPDRAYRAHPADGVVKHIGEDGACQCTCRRCERFEGGCRCPDCNGKCGSHLPATLKDAAGVTR